ncbi:MAG: hypothetical protein IJA58_07370, partial [Lachnospiraceae bacterium]|nr:hypothetical protein [Lachnospiraceae bacterium]
MKRMMAFLLAAVLVMSLLAGCGGGTNLDDKTTTKAPEQTTQGGQGEETQGETQGSEETTEAPKIEIEYPLKDAGKLTWYVQAGIDLHADYVDPSESPLHSYLSEATGVEITWRMVPLGGNPDTDFNLILQESPLPSVITGDNIRYEDLFRDEMIYDLTPYIEEYAPDYWAWLNEDEIRLKEVSLATGEIVYFASGIEELNTCSYGPMIRKDWLDECGLEIPYTLDEWEVVLTAFRDRYGIAPLSAAKAIWNGLFGTSAGTGAMGGFNLRFYREGDEIKCAQTQEEWKELIKVLADWYEKGLIDPDVGTINKSGILPKAAAGQIGLIICDDAHSSRIPLETAKFEEAEYGKTTAEWVPIPYPVPNKGDIPKYVRYEGMNKDHATVITTDCTEEELITAIKMLNFGYTEYGLNVWNFGQENVSWYYDENGEVQLTDLVINDPKGKTNALNKYSPMNDSIAPSIKTNRFAELRYEQISV